MWEEYRPATATRSSGQVRFVIHEVTDAYGNIIHRDFDAVRIPSGQMIEKMR